MINILGIYQIKNIINGKVYIGQSKDVEDRWKKHKRELSNNRNPAIYLQRAWNKYGEDKFIFNILQTVDTIEQLNEIEIYWISYFNSANRNFGYNISGGGGGNNICSEETREKLRKVQTGKKLSEETKRKIGNANRNRKHSPETIEKIKINNSNRIVSEETKRKISESNKGKHTGKQKNPRKKLSEETKAIRREKMLANGYQPWNKGKHWSDEVKIKISESNKKVIKYNKINPEQQQDIFKKYTNGLKIKDIANEYDVSVQSIYSIIKKLS